VESDVHNWDLGLRQATLGYNMSPMAGRKLAPFEVLFMSRARKAGESEDGCRALST